MGVARYGGSFGEGHAEDTACHRTDPQGAILALQIQAVRLLVSYLDAKGKQLLRERKADGRQCDEKGSWLFLELQKNEQVSGPALCSGGYDRYKRHFSLGPHCGKNLSDYFRRLRG